MPVKKIELYLEEVNIFRATGQFKADFETVRVNFIKFIVSLLEAGVLHKKYTRVELNRYFTKDFGGFPNLIRFLKKQVL